MGLTETILFYLLIGTAVAVSVWISAYDTDNRVFRAVSAVLFWPLYLPVLLTPVHREQPERSLADPPADELATRIAEVEHELDVAISGLDGWAEVSLTREQSRFVELRVAWCNQADRIREMDRLLENESVETDSSASNSDLILHSEQVRRDNIARLREVRNEAYADLTVTLARVRELVSMIHLAKFTGEPASRAEQLVNEIAAIVEGWAEVSNWKEPVCTKSISV